MNGRVWLLALGQTLTYAGVYYAFPALLPDLIAGTGWSVAQLAFGPTLGFLVMAALVSQSGRLLDRGYGPMMMVLGPILAAVCLIGLGLAEQVWQWNLLWVFIGVAQAGCLYETCFALLTRSEGDGLTARAAITRVTLVAGFASTLAFPLGHVLGAALGGQGALIAFAGLVALAALINFVALRGLAPVAQAKEASKLVIRDLLRKPMFWAITLIFSAVWLNHGMVLTYCLLLFEDRGASVATATLAASAIGPSQVVARLVLLVGERRISNARATLWALGAVVLAGIMLFAAGVAPQLIFAFAVLQGGGAGLLSVLRPVLVADRLGRAGFGAISGAVSIGPILATAAAPALGAGLLTLGGPAMILSATLAMACIGLSLAIWVLRRR
jgi:MFS family permease